MRLEQPAAAAAADAAADGAGRGGAEGLGAAEEAQAGRGAGEAVVGEGAELELLGELQCARDVTPSRDPLNCEGGGGRMGWRSASPPPSELQITIGGSDRVGPCIQGGLVPAQDTEIEDGFMGCQARLMHGVVTVTEPT